jgi:nucleoid-associated protein YgaU
MADNNRIEPTITLDNEIHADPAVNEPTIGDLIQKSEAKEAAGEPAVVLDESEGARIYREKVDAIVKQAHEQMEMLDKQAQDNLAISARAIKPEGGTPYDSYGEPLDLQVAADMRLAQIALRDEEVSKKFLERIGPKYGATITPLAAGNPSLLLTPENINDVKEVAPNYWTPEYQELFQDMGQKMLQSAGFSQEIIDRLDPSFVHYMGVTQKHENAFPVEGPGIAERLKEPSAKTMILDALANKNVQRSLKWAGLAIGCVTGGIVIKAGMTGAKFLVSKLAENESVRAFSKKLEDRAINVVSTTFNMDETKVRRSVDEAKGVAERLSRNKWVMLGGAAAMVGVAFALGHLDFVHDAKEMVAGAFHHDHTKVLEALTNAQSGHPGVNVADVHSAATVEAPVAQVAAVPEPVSVTPSAEASFANYAGVNPEAGLQNASEHGSFSNSFAGKPDIDAVDDSQFATAPTPVIGDNIASYAGVDPVAGAQNAASHGSFGTPAAPAAQAVPVDSLAESVTPPAPAPAAPIASYPGADAAGAENAAANGSLAAENASVNPPVLETGASAPTAAINEHVPASVHAPYGMFSAERSGLTSTTPEVRFPTGTDNLSINSGVSSGPAIAEPIAASAPSVADAGPTVASAQDAVANAVHTPVNHTIVKGDTLWGIVAKTHGGTNAEIQKLVGELYEANKGVIGANPDKIFPGQVLNLDCLTKSAEVSVNNVADAFTGPTVNELIANTKLDAVSLYDPVEVKLPVGTAEMAASRVAGTVTHPTLDGVVGQPILDTATLNAAALDNPGHVAFPAVKPNMALVGTDNVSSTDQINDAMKDMYKNEGQKAVTAKVDKFAAIDDWYNKS